MKLPRYRLAALEIGKDLFLVEIPDRPRTVREFLRDLRCHLIREVSWH